MTVTDTSRTVLLTGPTGGLGSALLEPIAQRRPAALVLVGRDPTRLTSAAERARAAGASTVHVVEADMSDLNSVASVGRAVTDLVRAGAPPIGTMLLNAGLQMTHDRAVSAQGIELTFAVNVVAQHALMRTLAGAGAGDAHVVLTGSGTHYGDWHSYGMVAPPQWQDPALLARPAPQGTTTDSQAGPRAYSTSKLAVLHLARAWQEHAHTNVRVNVFDPGLMPGTGLVRGAGAAATWAWNHALPAFTFLPGWSTPARSAAHLAAFALGETHGELRGGYVELGRQRRSSTASYDTSQQQRLWEYLEQVTGPALGERPAAASA